MFLPANTIARNCAPCRSAQKVGWRAVPSINTHMPPRAGEKRVQVRIGRQYGRRNIGRINHRVVEGANEQSRPLDARQKTGGTALTIVIVRAFIPVKRRSGYLVKFTQRTSGQHLRHIQLTL